MTRSINGSNALGAKTIFEFAAQEATLPWTDAAGSRVVTAYSTATITTSSPGPAADMGATGYFQSPSSPIVTAPFTMALMYRIGTNQSQCLMSINTTSSDSDYFEFWLNGLQLNARVREGGNFGDASGASLSTGTWYASAMICESDGVTIWHEGSMGSKVTHSVAPGGTGSRLGIGCLARSTAQEIFGTGYIKYATIFTGALSDAELDSWLADPEQIYGSGGSPAYAPPTYRRGGPSNVLLTHF